MAKPKFQKKKIQDTYGSGFKKYDENVGGGGSPNGFDASKHGHGVNSDYREQNNDTMQPRTKDGKFTYKSVNGKSIDPKYGPSRGETVNPLLTNGENGIKIEDVERDFANKSGSYWDKYKNKWYQDGSEIIGNDFKTRVAGDAIWNVAKRIYNEVTGDFGGKISFNHQLNNGNVKHGYGYGGKEAQHDFDEVKKGRKSADELKALQKAQKTGKEQAVIDPSSGAIKLKPGAPGTLPPVPKPQPTPRVAPTTPTQPSPTNPQPQPSPTSGTQTSAPTNGASSGGTMVNQGGSLKHTPDQFKFARAVLKANGQDASGFTDEQLDAFVDDYIDWSAMTQWQQQQNQTQPQSSNSQPVVHANSVDEDSETTKKVKGMGFSA